MEPRNWLSGASATPPTAPGTPSTGFASGGVPGVSPPTNPGPFWFHKIAEELRGVIVAGGLTPSDGSLTQLLTALSTLFGEVQILSNSGTVHGFSVRGLIVQWARTTFTDVPIGTPGATGSVTFLTPFTTSCLAAFPTLEVAPGDLSNLSVFITGRSTTAATFQIQEWSAGAQANGTVLVLAFGQ